MSKKRKKKGQLLLPFAKGDERVPKLFGLILLLLSFYLMVAFISYLFTWKADQDLVLGRSWDILWDDTVHVENWLGRLGAILSNMFIYWGFGLPSFILVLIMGYSGLTLLQGQKLRTIWPQTRNLLVVMASLSIFLSFVFSDASFPWGGLFGDSISSWLTGFLGNIGLVALFLFTALALLIWISNPTLDDFSARKFWYTFKQSPLDAVSDLFNLTFKAPARSTKQTKTRAMATTKSAAKNSSSGSYVDLDETPSDEPEDILAAAKLANAAPKDAPLQGMNIRDESTKAQMTPDDPFDLEVIETIPQQAIPDDARANNISPPPAAPPSHKDLSEPYDPTLELSSYEFPVLNLLDDHDRQNVEVDRAELIANKEQIVETLANFKIDIESIRATVGPTVTLYEIVPAKGIRISKIKNLEDDIALSLAALGIRIIAPIPGKGTIGIEVPNKSKSIVGIKEVLISDRFRRSKMELPIALGKTIQNEVFVADLAKMPHLLIAGATGQGKSVGINIILMSLLYKKHPSEVKLILIDPKKVELFPYAHLENHFLGFLPGEIEPILTENKKVVHTLNSLTIEMETRYNLLKKAEVRNISEYNEKFRARQLNPEKGHAFLPYIVLVIDEFADLIMTAGKEIELPLGRLAQLSRAVGIHLIIATQRPSVNIITGVIKANFPVRIAYKVTSKIDSRTILDAGGAEQLIGKGDMLISMGSDTYRLQCAFVSTNEIERVIQFISTQQGYPEPYFLPEFHDEEDEDGGKRAYNPADLDEYFVDCAKLVVNSQHGSTSMLQRRLKIGYNRAGRIMDQLESFGIVGPTAGSKPREVLIKDPNELDSLLRTIFGNN